MKDNDKQQHKVAAVALIQELGDPAQIMAMTGTKKFNYFGKTVMGTMGIRFDMARGLTKNKSCRVDLMITEGGKRSLYWWAPVRGQEDRWKMVDEAENIEPEKLREVWWEHTACALEVPHIFDVREVKFKLGRLVTTRGVSDSIPHSEVMSALRRHASCDWGDLDEDDKQANDRGLTEEYKDRLLSVYHAQDGTKFYIITEWDRSATTVLLPSEY